MKKIYQNKENGEFVIYSHTDIMDGEIYFKDFEGVEYSSPSSYWSSTYICLTKSVEKLEEKVKRFGDYMNEPIELSEKDYRNLLSLIRKFI